MGIQKFVVPMAGKPNPLRSHELVFGELQTDANDHGTLLYCQAWNGSQPYGLIIGFQVSEFVPDGETMACDVEIIDSDEIQEELRVIFSHRLEGPINFFG